MKFKRENGEVMLEGMIVMIITTLMMVWILGVGFLYYQKYVMRIITNDAATKIASTYDAPTTDIIMGYISASDLSKRELYGSPDLTDINNARSESYVKYILDKSNLAGTIKDVDVDLEKTTDSLGRSHVKLTTECSFRTPFGAGLELFGMSGTTTYSVTSYAESTNLTDYVSAVTLADAITNGTFFTGTGFVDKTLKMINSFIAMCHQVFS